MLKCKKIIIICIFMCVLSILVSCKEEPTVTYNINFYVEGVLYHSVSPTENQKLVFPMPPSKDEHQFLGWVDESGSDISEGMEVKKDMELNAKFAINQYTITYDYNDGQTSSKIEQHDFGAKIKAPDSPIRVGYTFNGWYLNDEEYEFTKMPNENIVLVAKWTLDEVIVSFDSQGGTSVTKIIALPGTTITAPKDPYRQGCKFLGWYLNDELYEFTTMPSENITLVAKWQDTTYTITYELNGGVGDGLITTYSSARPSDIDLGRPTKEGYAFMGWYTNPGFNGGPMLTINNKTNKNLTLYAKWVEQKTKEVKTIGVYGDSISTYDTYIPSDAAFYYPSYSATVKNVEHTWWRILQEQYGLSLVKNVSYSGSTVSGSNATCGVSGARIKKLIDSNGVAPDIIIILLGINDVVNGFTTEKFESEYRLMLDKMKEICPNSDVIMCDLMYDTCTEGQNPDPKYDAYTHPGLRDAYNVIIEKIAGDYQYPLVKLSEVVTKETEFVNNWHYLGDNIHPSYEGMKVIAEAIGQKILENY